MTMTMTTKFSRGRGSGSSRIFKLQVNLLASFKSTVSLQSTVYDSL